MKTKWIKKRVKSFHDALENAFVFAFDNKYAYLSAKTYFKLFDFTNDILGNIYCIENHQEDRRKDMIRIFNRVEAYLGERFYGTIPISIIEYFQRMRKDLYK